MRPPAEEREPSPARPRESEAGWWKGRSWRPALLAAALACAGALAAAPLSREGELAAIRAEIQRLTARLDTVRGAQTGLRGEVAAATLQLQLQQQKIAEAVAARNLAASRIEAGEQEVARLTVALETARQGLQRRVAGLYRLGRQGYFRLLLAVKPDRRFIPSIRLIRYLAQRDYSAIATYRETRRRLESERSGLLAQRAEADRWVRNEEVRRRQLFALRQHKADLLARLDQEQRSLSEETVSLAEKERKLSAFVDLLTGREGGGTLAGTPIQQLRGVLDWPVQGRVSAGFGPRLDPRYRTQVPHNGIDIATTPESEVKAVFPGKVLYSAPFEGYGNTVIVQHPGRVFTLYAGLASVKVVREGMVSLGDVVGRSADTLYFEIRVENRPENPLTWLR
jgi:septal ring factor EnvC (AmiA/AmiB activator)